MQLDKIMQRTILIFAIVAGILTAPFLCDAGVTAHECHCDSVECCTDEGAACEPDPCDDVYKGTRQIQAPIDAIALAGVVIDASVAPTSDSTKMSQTLGFGGNQPFPDSDLPLRV